MPTPNDIVIKNNKETWIISQRTILNNRSELPGLLEDLKRHIPPEHVVGPPFCILLFVSSVTEGYDAEVCFPVSSEFGAGSDQTRILPGMQVLSITHQGGSENLGESYRKLYAWAADLGIISDEFCLEIYPDPDTAGQGTIEIQFVIHPWEWLLDQHLERVLGEKKARQIGRGREKLLVTSPLEERFIWVRGAVERLENQAEDGERYEVLSRCSHVFPSSQIEKLRAVYLAAEKRTDDMLEAVDAVIDFMGEDPGWGERPLREGYTLLCSKKPRDPEGYQQAVSAQEKKRAYCFCPLVRGHLEEGLPSSFCYCGAGWYRQQWEGALGRPVKIKIIHSLLQGDDICEFAVQLPEE